MLKLFNKITKKDISGSKKMNNNFKIVNNDCYVRISDEEIKVNIDNYDNIEYIDSGGNSCVFKGKHKTTNRIDIIKIYVPNENNKSNIVSEEQFRREICKTASLNDKRFVTIYDAYSKQEGIYICTMEYIKGVKLQDWYKNNNINKYQRIEVCIKLLEAIIYYQEKGILHGDLHNKNIIIDNANGIHIIDFGSSIFNGQREENYEKERESFLICDNIKKILGELFDKNFFIFKLPSNKDNDKYINNDVRHFEPYLVAKTLLAYVKYIDYNEQLIKGEETIIDITNLCITITDSIYIDYKYFIAVIYSKYNKLFNDVNKIINIIYNNINNKINLEDCTNEEFETRNEDILNAYYFIAKQNINKWNISQAQKLFESEVLGYNINFKKYYNDIKNMEYENYNQFKHIKNNNISDDLKIKEFDNNYRLLFYYSLRVFYGNDLDFIVALWENISLEWCKRICNPNK